MSDWHAVTLNELSTQRKGINYKSEDYSDEYFGHPFITIKCFVKGGGYEPAGIKYYGGFSTMADILSTGDILFSVTDLTRAGDIVGSPLRVPAFGNAKPPLASMDCMRIDPIVDRCDKSFLYHRMMLSDVRRQMVAYSAGSTVLHLDTKKVPSISVRVPADLNAQCAIATILDTIDQAIEKTEALIEKYQQIKAGLIHDLFTRGIGADGKLRPPREQAQELYQQTPIGWVPKEWEVAELKDVYKNPIRDFGSFSSTNLITFLEEGVPFIKSEMIKEEEIDWTGCSFISTSVHNLLSKSHVEQGQILFSKIGSALGKAVLYGGERGECNSNAAVAKIDVDARIVKPQLVEIYLNSAFARKQFELMIISLLPRINLGDINKVLVPLPEIEEQNLICKRYTTLRAKLRSEKGALSKLQNQKTGIMHDLLTGRVQVNVEQPEAAVV